MRFVVLFSMILLSVPAVAQRNYPPDLPDASEHVYRTVDGVDLKLWVFAPDRDGSTSSVIDAADTDVQVAESSAKPAIVFFFGGGWKQGSPEQFAPQCRYLASRGMVAVTADYRVAERHGVKADACVTDCKAAVAWLREHAAALNIDPARICAAGGSAGGHTACCTALIDDDASGDSKPNALALFNPAVILAPLDGFEATNVSAERWQDIASRTGVPPEDISPIHHVRAGLPPTIIFHGTADTAVPYATVREFTSRMHQHGNRCELKTFAGAPHGFFNAPRGNDAARRDQSQHWHQRTMLQLDQFLQDLGWLSGPATIHTADRDFVCSRGTLQNSLRRFAVEKVGHVAFLGGSITEMKGYRPKVQQWLQQRFPDTDFTFTNAGIASTGSTTGAFRVRRDVLDQGPVDLFLVEFAVNDDQDEELSAADCIRGMEGIIRQVRHHNPAADIVMVQFVNESMLHRLNEDRPIVSVRQHEKVARHYGISSVNLPRLLNWKIQNDEMSWEQYGGTHPKDAGNQLAADQVIAILQAGWEGRPPENVSMQKHEIPQQPLDRSSYDRGHLLPVNAVSLDDGWQVSIPDWKSLPGSKRQRFVDRDLLHSTTAGSTAEFEFVGTAVGAYVLAGPDAGVIECSIDGGPWQSIDLFHRFSRGLHYPRTVMLAKSLPDEKHRITVRVGSPRDGRGSAVRVLHFVVNGSPDF